MFSFPNSNTVNLSQNNNECEIYSYFKVKGVNQMSKYGSSIYKRKDGRWEGRYVVGYKNNRSIYKSVYAKSVNELEQKMQCILVNNIDKPITFIELIYSWLCYGKIKNKKSTHDKYNYIIDKHIKNEIGETRLKDLTSVQVNQFLNNKLKHYSSSYVKTMAIIIKSAIDYGHKEQLTELSNIQVNMPFSPKNEVIILELDEQRQLETYIKYNQSLTALGVMLSLYAGLRIGEVCALKWNNIDFKNHVITVDSTIIRIKNENNKWIYKIGPPKTTHSKRDIPITDNLYRLLTAEFSNKKSPYIVSSQESFLNIRTFEYRYHKLLNDADLYPHHFHTFRHTFATRCIESGVDIKTLSEILGHSSVSFTLNTYVHPSFQEKCIQMEKLNNLTG